MVRGRLRDSPNHGNQVQNSAAENDGSQERRHTAAAFETYHAAQRGLPLLTEPLGCDERRPIMPMEREWRNCSQVIPSWDAPVLIDRITPSNKRALPLLNLAVLSFECSSRCRTAVVWRPSTCAAVPTVMKAGTVAISDLAINKSALIVRCDPPRPRVE